MKTTSTNIFSNFPQFSAAPLQKKKNNNQHQVDLWQIFGKQWKEKQCFMMKLQVSKIPEKPQKRISVIRGISGPGTYPESAAQNGF